MPGLRELQARFAQAIWNGNDAVTADISSNGLSATRRLAVYRNNTLAGLSAALRDGFPVVERLVGDGFFDVLAGDFVRAHPPQSACLLEYGGTFAGFIANYRGTAGLPYLPDVARLEWAWNEAFHGRDAATVTLEMLQGLSPEEYPRVGLSLHPSVRLVSSRWPVLRIYQVNQPGYEGDDAIELDREAGCRVLVLRNNWDVELHALTEGEFTLLSALDNHSSLASALECAGSADKSFDPAAALLRALRSGFFSRLTIENRSSP